MVNNQDNAEHHHSALGREQPPEDRVEHVPDEVNSTTVKYEEDKTHVGYDARKVRKTAILYMSFIALGLSAGIAGPTLVDMQLLLGIDTKSISVLFTAHGLGYLAGSIVCGLVYNKATPELQFTVACFTMALATAAAPWSRTLGGFVITMVVQAIAMGYIDADCGRNEHGRRVCANEVWA